MSLKSDSYSLKNVIKTFKNASILNKTLKGREVLKMPEGRCMKCKEQVTIKDPKDTTIKSRGGELAAVHGTCPKCGTKVFRIVGKKK